MFMARVLCFLSSLLTATFRLRLSLQLEIAALRHQLSTYRLKGQKPRIGVADRLLWSVIAVVVTVARGPVFRPTTNGHAVAAEEISGLLAGTESR